MVQKIVVTRHLGDKAMAILESSPYELIVNPEDAEPSREWVLKQVGDPDVVAACIMHGQPCDKVNAEWLAAAAKGLKCVSTMSVGFDHIDVKAANARGIKVGHTAGVLSDAVADTTVMLLLMTMRRVEEGIATVKAGGWSSYPWSPFQWVGPSITSPNTTIGFLGFGRISQAVLSRLVAFTNKKHPARVLYNSTRARPNQADIDADLTKEFRLDVKRAEKEDVARESDVLIILCPLTDETKDLVNKDFLRQMKKTSVLINVARGPVVNSEDLAEALKDGTIYAAGLDVLTGEPNIPADHPLVQAKNCLVLPHMGSADIVAREAMARLTAENALAGANGEVLPTEVKL